MPIRSVAIVGAGLAGLACAKSLAAREVQAVLFDKGRAPGGRMATRRIEHEGHAFAFDHGAQYVTARGELFRGALDAALAKPWLDETRFVGVPRMSAIPRRLAEGLEVEVAREVIAIGGQPGAWRLRHVAPRPAGRAPAMEVIEESGPYEAVVLAIPAPQAMTLLKAPAPHLAGVLQGVRMAPCWTLMIAFDGRVALPDTLRPVGGAIGWAARDSSKPGRDAATECWVVQAGPDWTRAHLERPAAEIVTELTAAFAALAGGSLPVVIQAAAHRWRHALVETPLGAPCLWDPALGLGAAGDWCIAARAEAAVESGAALAESIVLA
jgi:predicted NAD/FAD-dependent oxidoreductase